MDKYFYLIEYLNLSVGIFRLLESGWGFLLIEYNSSLLSIVDKETYYKKGLVFHQTVACPQIHWFIP